MSSHFYNYNYKVNNSLLHVFLLVLPPTFPILPLHRHLLLLPFLHLHRYNSNVFTTPPFPLTFTTILFLLLSLYHLYVLLTSTSFLPLYYLQFDHFSKQLFPTHLTSWYTTYLSDCTILPFSTTSPYVISPLHLIFLILYQFSILRLFHHPLPLHYLL